MNITTFALWALIGFFNLLTVSPVFGDKLTLDLNSDEKNEWFGINCLFNDDYNDFMPYGCDAGIPSDKDIYPDRRGFWSPCEAQTCDIYYFGGSQAPHPKKIDLKLYVKGSAKVKVSYKYGPVDPEDYKVIRQESIDKESGWHNVGIDLSDERKALQLKITLSKGRNDVILLDEITLDLGENEALPTDPPPTTTVMPINSDNEFTLDSNHDSWVVWKSDCGYVEDLADMWHYGCNKNIFDSVDDNNSKGFWSSCEKRNCSVRYVGKPEVILQPIPSTISVSGYLSGDASINLKLKTNLLELNCKSCQPLGTINSKDGKGWVQKEFKLDEFKSKNFVLVFEILNDLNGGVAILDKVDVKLRSQQKPDGSKEDTGSGSLKTIMNWITILASLTTSSILMKLKLY